VGAAYLLLLAVKFDRLIASTYLNADAASAPVIGQLYGGSPAHRQVILGELEWFSTLIFELATRWMPLHRQIWEAAPYALVLASVALIAWGAFKVGGRWAGAMTGVVLLCASPRVIYLVFSLDDHSPTWFSLALLAGVLVLFESQTARLKPWLIALLVIVVGVTVGVNAASDVTLLAAGVAPVLLAAAGTWILAPGRHQARAWWLTVATMAIAGVSDVATRTVMRHQSVTIPTVIVHNQLAAAEAVSANFKWWWQSLMVLGNGNFFGERLTFTSTLELTCALLTILAVALIPRFTWRELAHALELRSTGAPRAATRTAWILYWSSSAVLLSAGFIFSSNPQSIASSRFLLGVLYAAAALVPLMVRRSVLARAAITAGCTIFAFTGLVSLLQNQAIPAATDSFQNTYAQVERIAAREHLTVGYADYWDATPLTWITHFRVKAYPVQNCGTNLCVFDLHIITSWYIPRANQRTFLITNTAQPIPATPSPILGKPSATYQIGTLTMYVYPYDIASRLLP
jgi:hypothetical protein